MELLGFFMIVEVNCSITAILQVFFYLKVLFILGFSIFIGMTNDSLFIQKFGYCDEILLGMVLRRQKTMSQEYKTTSQND